MNTEKVSCVLFLLLKIPCKAIQLSLFLVPISHQAGSQVFISSCKICIPHRDDRNTFAVLRLRKKKKKVIRYLESLNQGLLTISQTYKGQKDHVKK